MPAESRTAYADSERPHATPCSSPPRAGAADPNDRVFVRADNNDYTVPGFADEDSFDPSLSDPSFGDGNFLSASGPLPEHVRREILELGLPDDGYNYLSHLRELRPAAVAASSFVPSSTARPEPVPLDVKVTPFSTRASVFFSNWDWNA